MVVSTLPEDLSGDTLSQASVPFTGNKPQVRLKQTYACFPLNGRSVVYISDISLLHQWHQ